MAESTFRVVLGLTEYRYPFNKRSERCNLGYMPLSGGFDGQLMEQSPIYGAFQIALGITLGVMSTIFDTILWLQSQTTSEQFPIVQFSGDTDMVTDGWLSLTSVNQPEVVVTQASVDEYRAIAKGNDGYLKVQHRVNAALRRTDLRCSWLVGVEELAKTAQGTSFQEFRKSYQPPKLLFKDIFAQDSVATETSRTSRFEFESNGGKLVVLQ